jgi:hypothetical protein
MKRLLNTVGLLLPFFMYAQDSSKPAPTLTFENVDNTPVKVYCNQKVLNQTPNRFISIGYEYQSSSNLKAEGAAWNDNRKIEAMQGLRINFNTPLISKNKLIISLGGQYARTAFDGANQFPYPLFPQLVDNGLHTAGLNTTIFKPLNEKNFFIIQVNTDANWLASTLKNINTKAITFSSTALYGWKKSEAEMFGLGISRTYRMGRLIYVPVVLYNKTFNDKWGLEATFPAKAHVRRNINPKSILQLGYELEGNQFALYSTNASSAPTFLQRGEIKPRLIYERSLFGFWWLSAQTGLRVNGRFNVVDKYDGKEQNQIIINTLTNPFYFNISLNLVSL